MKILKIISIAARLYLGIRLPRTVKRKYVLRHAQFYPICSPDIL